MNSSKNVYIQIKSHRIEEGGGLFTTFPIKNVPMQWFSYLRNSWATTGNVNVSHLTLQIKPQIPPQLRINFEYQFYFQLVVHY